MAYFEKVRVRVLTQPGNSIEMNCWRQKTFTSPWNGSPISEWCHSLGWNIVRRTKVLVNGKWFRKSGANSQVMALDKEGRKP